MKNRIILYSNDWIHLEWKREAPQNFFQEDKSIVREQGIHEDANLETKLIQLTAHFSPCLGFS